MSMSTLSSREMVMVDPLCKSVCGCWMGEARGHRQLWNQYQGHRSPVSPLVLRHLLNVATVVIPSLNWAI